MEITTKFDERYFLPRSQPAYRLSDYQRFLAISLHVQLARAIMKIPGVKIYKEFGLLLPQDVEEYTRQGYIIGPTSDLMFGRSVPLPRDSRRFVQFGGHFNLSVGAIHVAVEGTMSPLDFFKRLVLMAATHKLQLGDILYQEGGRLARPSIYIANDRGLVLSRDVVRRYFPITHYAISTNGGVSYKKHSL